eukprot:5570826-Pyramimonas_sp.AAC.1
MARKTGSEESRLDRQGEEMKAGRRGTGGRRGGRDHVSRYGDRSLWCRGRALVLMATRSSANSLSLPFFLVCLFLAPVVATGMMRVSEFEHRVS